MVSHFLKKQFILRNLQNLDGYEQVAQYCNVSEVVSYFLLKILQHSLLGFCLFVCFYLGVPQQLISL